MSGNSIGKLFTVTSFGESHGPALGCIIDGCPPGLPLEPADMQHDLNRRKPGTSRFTTQGREADEVRILSGVFEVMLHIGRLQRETRRATVNDAAQGRPMAFTKAGHSE